MEEIRKLSEPIMEYLAKNYDPHCTVVITDRQVRLVRDEFGVPRKMEAASISQPLGD